MRFMNQELRRPTSREFLKAIGIEHLDESELQLLRERKLDKEATASAIVHIAECHACCLLVPVLTAEEISDALAQTAYGKPDYIEQTVAYYIETLATARAMK